MYDEGLRDTSAITKTVSLNYSQIIFGSFKAHYVDQINDLKKLGLFLALPVEVDDLKFNLNFFGSGCLVHLWSPFGSLCRFKALIGPYLGSLGP